MLIGLVSYVGVGVACSLYLPSHVGYASADPQPLSTAARVIGGLLWPVVFGVWLAGEIVGL